MVPYHLKATDCARECVVLAVEEENNVVIAYLAGSTLGVQLAENNVDFAAGRMMSNGGAVTFLDGVIEDDKSSGPGNMNYSFLKGHGIGYR